MSTKLNNTVARGSSRQSERPAGRLVVVALNASEVEAIAEMCHSGIASHTMQEVPPPAKVPAWWKRIGRRRYCGEHDNPPLYLRDPEVSILAKLAPHLA